jgi:hypothetical protein
MARHSIVEKLHPVLTQPIETEMQVVYILVELRKLLEHDGNKDLYPVLNFYGDWVVHTKLSSSRVADRIVRLFDEVMHRKVNDTIDLRLEEEAVSFFNETLLREQLRTLLGSVGLPTELCTNDTNWHDFRKKLAGVIEDAPLELKPSKTPNPTHFVESLIVKNKSTDAALNVEWSMVMHSQPIVEVNGGKMKLKTKVPTKPQSSIV